MKFSKDLRVSNYAQAFFVSDLNLSEYLSISNNYQLTNLTTHVKIP